MWIALVVVVPSVVSRQMVEIGVERIIFVAILVMVVGFLLMDRHCHYPLLLLLLLYVDEIVNDDVGCW